MSNDDDIERLLREVEGATSGKPAAKPPATRQESAPATTSARSEGATKALVISVAIGIIGLLLGFLPLVPDLWLGLAAFLGSWSGLTVYRRLS